ncbi:MAG TPA: hypothetical protein VE978_16930, partial [Chitinophagales bacterium]|nr:hypothetical protein [Chitinophagales bacterium]
MRTILLFLLAQLPVIASAQQAIIAEDFESYSAGDLLADTSPLWTTWSGGIISEDAYISNAYAISGSNSLNVVGYFGPTDLILPFPQDYTSGVYEFSLKMYITSGNGGYFNIQASSTPGVDWMFEVYFDSTGGGYINAGGSMAATFTYAPDTWMSLNVNVNLDNDLGEFFINSHSIHSWQWSTGALGTSSINQVGGVDIYSYSADSSDANMFIDNVLLTKNTTTGIIVEDFERNTPDQLLSANSD